MSQNTSPTAPLGGPPWGGDPWRNAAQNSGVNPLAWIFSRLVGISFVLALLAGLIAIVLNMAGARIPLPAFLQPATPTAAAFAPTEPPNPTELVSTDDPNAAPTPYDGQLPLDGSPPPSAATAVVTAPTPVVEPTVAPAPTDTPAPTFTPSPTLSPDEGGMPADESTSSMTAGKTITIEDRDHLATPGSVVFVSLKTQMVGPRRAGGHSADGNGHYSFPFGPIQELGLVEVWVMQEGNSTPLHHFYLDLHAQDQ